MRLPTRNEEMWPEILRQIANKVQVGTACDPTIRALINPNHARRGGCLLDIEDPTGPHVKSDPSEQLSKLMVLLSLLLL